MKSKPSSGNRSKKGLGAVLRGLFVGSSQGALEEIEGALRPNGIDFGVSVNSTTALKFTAVFAAVKLLAENIATLPKQVLVETPEGLKPASDHAAHRLLSVRPNEYTDRFTFWFSVLSNAFLEGNGYAVITTGDDYRPAALHRVNPKYTDVVFVNGSKAYVVNDPDPDMAWLNGTYLEHEMIHIMFFTLDGVHGIDPITYNAVTIGRGIATQKFAAEFYKRGGQIKGTLETDSALTDDEYGTFMKHYSEAAGNFETPLLEYGIKYKNIGISPIAAQLIQSETLSIQDIARIFSVPPHLLGELSHATFSNIEQQNIFFASYSLRPYCKRIEEQLELKLFTSSEQGRYSVKFDLRGMMRGDDAARAAYYSSGINSGWMTPNEARQMENLRMLPGLDAPRVPLNTAFVDKDGELINPNDESTKNE